VVLSKTVGLLVDARRAASNPAQADFVQLQTWARDRPLVGDRSGGEALAWARRGLLPRTVEWLWQLRHGRPSLLERANRRYDILTVEIMRRVLRPDSNCLDIGAATGQILRFMRVLAPDGRHHAFEPIPFQASKLRLRFPEVQVHDLALSDQAGEVEFFVVKDDPCISALRDPQEIRGLVGDTRITDWHGQVETIQVNTRPLDEELDGSGTVDFIKMDVEGAEVSVFRGAQRTLAENQPTVVFEYSGESVERLYGATNLLDTLSEVGLRVSSLEGWVAGDPPLEPGQFPNRDPNRGFVNWMYVAHPAR
jgi:FkbM family methyltransferase